MKRLLLFFAILSIGCVALNAAPIDEESVQGHIVQDIVLNDTPEGAVQDVKILDGFREEAVGGFLFHKVGLPFPATTEAIVLFAAVYGITKHKYFLASSVGYALFDFIGILKGAPIKGADRRG